LSGQAESVRLDQRLSEIDRVLDDVDVRQQIAVPDEPLGHMSPIAQHQSVASDPPGFQMVGFDNEHRALPATEGKPLPRVGRKVRRPRAAVHENLALLFHPLNVGMNSDHLPALGIDVVPDAEIADASEPVGRRVRLALVLGQGEQRRVPGFRTPTSRLGDRQAEKVADIRARGALDRILVHDRRPDTGKIDLRGCRHSGHHPRQRNQGQQPSDACHGRRV
jgi:hypothetical protein